MISIYAVEQSSTYVTGATAPGADMLGDWAGSEALCTVDAGADLYDGGVAAGRRVQLPWGGGDFDIAQLNANGRLLLERAIDWAAGSTTVSVTVEKRVSSSNDDAEEYPNGQMYRDSSDLELVTEDDVQTVGMRFTGIGVPTGATITNAFIQFTVDEATSGSVSLSIRGHDTGDAAGDLAGNKALRLLDYR